MKLLWNDDKYHYEKVNTPVSHLYHIYKGNKFIASFRYKKHMKSYLKTLRRNDKLRKKPNNSGLSIKKMKNGTYNVYNCNDYVAHFINKKDAKLFIKSKRLKV